MNSSDVKIKSEKILHQGFLKISEYQLQHKRFDGNWTPELRRELVHRPNAVGVLLYDPSLNQVVLIEQFRLGGFEAGSPWLIEIVAGLVEKNEDPESVARREVLEEAGLTVQTLMPVFDYWVTPGISDERIILYCGKVDARHAGGIHGLKEEHEDIRVFAVPTAEAFEMRRTGKIKNAIALMALLWLECHQEAVNLYFHP